MPPHAGKKRNAQAGKKGPFLRRALSGPAPGGGACLGRKKPGAVGLRARELRCLPGKGQDISAAGVGLGLTVRVMVSGTSSPGRTIRPMMTYR